MTEITTPKPKGKRGFASMSPEKRRAIAQKGGAAVKIRSFQRDPELARRAGRLGGLASRGGGRPGKVEEKVEEGL